MRFWPRSIRWQMLAALILLELLSFGLFIAITNRQQSQEINERARQRLVYETASLARQAGKALEQKQPDWGELAANLTGESPTVALAEITDPAGNVLFVSKAPPEDIPLDSVERAQIPLVRGEDPHLFTHGRDQQECVAAVYTAGQLRGFAWVEYDQTWAQQRIRSILQGTVVFGIIWIAASAILALLMANSITRQLAVLHRGTRALMTLPESGGNFPLPVTVPNEIGDLIQAFNSMVASLAEQRQELKNTLSLLDSMLANAPIGLIFLDSEARIVRANQVFADMTGAPIDSHLGRSLPELLPQPVAHQLEDAVRRVFDTEAPVRNLELNGHTGAPANPWTWLVSAYPVRSAHLSVHWAGVIVLDATARKRSEEALRKTEKLAATGRLAASVAHEINNPLEAITNLLFLLRNHCGLQDPALSYVVLAEHEARRVAEITQQTLRFYRQSTLPARATMTDLLDSVLSLHQGRLNALNLQVERSYDPKMDLFCFSGEIRQVFANLVGNAIDASAPHGRLLVRARRSRHWKATNLTGIRFAVADTGQGMEPAVLARIFEAFFTTKEATGTGLGLWVSHEIVLKHGGMIHVRSRAAATGKPSGAVFQIFLPDSPILAAADIAQETVAVA
jgi:PAS domain S-box-containing protein